MLFHSCFVLLFDQIESFVMSMSYGDGQLWYGDKQGSLHAMDTRDGLFNEDNTQVSI